MLFSLWYVPSKTFKCLTYADDIRYRIFRLCGISGLFICVTWTILVYPRHLRIHLSLGLFCMLGIAMHIDEHHDMNRLSNSMHFVQLLHLLRDISLVVILHTYTRR